MGASEWFSTSLLEMLMRWCTRLRCHFRREPAGADCDSEKDRDVVGHRFDSVKCPSTIDHSDVNQTFNWRRYVAVRAPVFHGFPIVVDLGSVIPRVFCCAQGLRGRG